MSDNIDKIDPKSILINKNIFIKLTQENEKFIVDNCEKQIKKIIEEFNKKFNINIHEKQLVNILHKYRKKTISFYKKTPEIVEFIIKKIKENSIYTIVNIYDIIVEEFKIKISRQLIYNILEQSISCNNTFKWYVNNKFL